MLKQIVSVEDSVWPFSLLLGRKEDLWLKSQALRSKEHSHWQ